MKISRLYQIFCDENTEVAVVEQLDRLMEDDFVRLQTVSIGMQHFLSQIPVFRKYYPEDFDKVFPEVRNKTCRRLYSLVEKVDVQGLVDRRISLYKDELTVLRKSLGELLEFFEDVEEYLSCAKIKAILDFLDTQVVVLEGA